MSALSSIRRELAFLRRDRTAVAVLAFVLITASIAVFGGIAEVRYQQDTIERLLSSDEADRMSALSQHLD